VFIYPVSLTLPSVSLLSKLALPFHKLRGTRVQHTEEKRARSRAREERDRKGEREGEKKRGRAFCYFRDTVKSCQSVPRPADGENRNRKVVIRISARSASGIVDRSPSAISVSRDVPSERDMIQRYNISPMQEFDADVNFSVNGIWTFRDIL